MTKNEAKAITGGGLTRNSKINAQTLNLSAWACKTGGTLATVAGTICAGCYAQKGRYAMNRAKHANGYQARLEAFNNPLWLDAMVKLLQKENYFRFFSSGDLQSVEMLEKIVALAERLPNLKIWLPTRERGIIGAFLANGGLVPDNLTIRISAASFDAKSINNFGLPTSSSHKKAAPLSGSFICKAPDQEGKCLECRACWHSEKNISYAYH